MGGLPDTTSPGIRAGLLRLKAKRRERQLTVVGCVRNAFDLIAAAWLETKGTLDDTDLKQKIPELVLEGAVEFGWVQYPRQRKVQRRRTIPDAWIPGARVIDWVSVPVPDSELVENFGCFKVEAEFGTWFRGLLAGRIAHWQAEVLTRVTPGSLPQHSAGECIAKPNESEPGRSEAATSGLGADERKNEREASQRLFEGLPAKQQDLERYFHGLTNRQHDCASLKWEYGLPDLEIARRLGLHHSTVQEHLLAARKRMDAAKNSEKKKKVSAKFKPGRLNEEH